MSETWESDEKAPPSMEIGSIKALARCRPLLPFYYKIRQKIALLPHKTAKGQKMIRIVGTLLNSFLQFLETYFTQLQSVAYNSKTCVDHFPRIAPPNKSNKSTDKPAPWQPEPHLYQESSHVIAHRTRHSRLV